MTHTRNDRPLFSAPTDPTATTTTTDADASAAQPATVTATVTPLRGTGEQIHRAMFSAS